MSEEITLGEAINNIQNNYKCNYCGENPDNHEDAVRHMLHKHVTTREVTL